MAAAGGADPGLRVRVGGALLFRTQQAGHVQVPGVQPDGRLAHVVGNPDAPAALLSRARWPGPSGRILTRP